MARTVGMLEIVALDSLPPRGLCCVSCLQGGMRHADHPYMGLSENSVPLNPMVNDDYPY